MAERWISDEPRLVPVVARVVERASRRWTRVLGVALAVTCAAVAARVLKAPRQEATLYFRMSEGEVTTADRVLPAPSDIREYIANVALSREKTEAMMRKHGVYLEKLRHDPAEAVAKFREKIDIAVTRNYFLWDRVEGDPPRTAIVSVALTWEDEDETRALLGEIRDAIVSDQAQRVSQLEQARQFFETRLAESRKQIEALQQEIERLTGEARKGDAAARIATEARIAALRAEAGSAIEQGAALHGAASATELTRSAERSQLGLALELFDQEFVALAPRLTPAQLARRAAAIFAVALVLAALGVGAFDDRLWAPEDVASAGVRLFGALPSFPGDEAGSYRSRAVRS